MMPHSRWFSTAIISGLLLLSGCQRLSVWMTQRWGSQPAAVKKVSGEGKDSGQSFSPEDQPDQKPEEKNAQLLLELYRVVLVGEPQSRTHFTNWWNALNQGASIEGIYRGFTRSDYQRHKESNQQSQASPKSLNEFSFELAELLLELPKVPDFTQDDAQPLLSILPPGAGADEGEKVSTDRVVVQPPRDPSFMPFEAKQGAQVQKPDKSTLQKKIAEAFIGASIFTLKRVLGEWALQVIDVRLEESPGRLRDWYARFASRASQKGVDFGSGVRNIFDPEYHRKWANQATEDQIRWEVLNRLHRILNHSQGF